MRTIRKKKELSGKVKFDELTIENNKKQKKAGQQKMLLLESQFKFYEFAIPGFYFNKLLSFHLLQPIACDVINNALMKIIFR